MYAGGLTNEKLNLIHSANKLVKIVVKTPIGKTASEVIKNVVIQGDVLGTMLCSKQVDLFGKDCIEKNKHTYKYKNEIEIPPLTMVDDRICISECGYKSVMVKRVPKSYSLVQKSARKCHWQDS